MAICKNCEIDIKDAKKCPACGKPNLEISLKSKPKAKAKIKVSKKK